MVDAKEAIVGYTGFVGGFLRESRPDADLYNSKNIETMRGRTYDTVYCAGLPATKWLVNNDPATDKRNIDALKDVLMTVAVHSHFVLISTIDVHDHAHAHQQEHTPIVPSSEPYGRHRYEFEEWVVNTFGAHVVTVLRLPALFGVGLKKNVLFDLVHERLLGAVRLDSVFQWYDMRWLDADIQYTLDNSIRLAHLYPEPIQTRDIVTAFFPHLLDRIQTEASVGGGAPVYNHDTVYPGFRRTARAVLAGMADFITVYRSIHSTDTAAKLVVSNLHWEPRHDEHAVFLLQRYGISAVELAPTKYATGPHASPGELWEETLARLPGVVEWYRQRGVAVHSVQSVLYGYQTGTLASLRPELVRHLRRLLGLANELGIRALVLGSPKLRVCSPGETYKEACACLAGILQEAAEGAPRDGAVLCLEPNASGYGCDVGTTVHTVSSDILAHVPDGLPVGINFDTGNHAMEGAPCFTDAECRRVAHVQVSAPLLGPIASLPSEVLAQYREWVGKAMSAAGRADTAVSLETTAAITHMPQNLFLFTKYFQ